jgi:hypothetical protein
MGTGRAKTAAKLAAEVAVPELAVPLELVLSAMSRGRPEPGPASPSGAVLVPPSERTHLLTYGKDKVRVVERKGVKLVLVERAPHVSALEVVAAAAIAGVAYEYTKHGGSVLPGVGHNALGIPFRSVFPGGGANPLNYLFG